MPPDEPVLGGAGKVTTREFYDALLRQNERMDAMERRIINRLDEMTRVEPPALSARVKTAERDIDALKARLDEAHRMIDELRIQSVRGDKFVAAMTGALTVIASTFAAWVGTR